MELKYQYGVSSKLRAEFMDAVIELMNDGRTFDVLEEEFDFSPDAGGIWDTDYGRLESHEPLKMLFDHRSVEDETDPVSVGT